MRIPKPPKLTKIGNTRPICPYCGSRLKSMISRKTACPHCGKAIYKRTRPKDGKDILVREDQVDLIQMQWWVKNGTYAQNMKIKLTQEKKYQAVKKERMKKYGKASDYDIKWQMFRQDLIKNSKSSNWSSYRMTKFEMAKLQISREDYNTALMILCEILYLDLHGPNDMRGNLSRERLAILKPFDQRFSIVADGVIRLVERCMKKGNIPLPKVKETFFRIANAAQSYISTPIKIPTAWKKISEKLA